MKTTFLSLFAVIAMPLISGCNSLGGVPEFVDAGIAPQALHPGDTALITIDVKDKNDIVAGIVGVIEEDPSRKLKLHDDGEEGDVNAGDKTWSLAVKVPLEAPPGAFNLTFTAYRADGVAVPIRADDGSIASLSARMQVIVSYK